MKSPILGWYALSPALMLMSACASPPDQAPKTNQAALRQVGAEVLFWSQAERDGNFPAMEKLFPGDTARASPTPRLLPQGKPLSLGAGDPVGAHMAAQNVAGLLVLQNGAIRMERYARGYSEKGRYTSFSVAKSLTSTLVGAAIADGFIKSVDDPVTRYIPALKDSAYEGVSIEQVLTMTSGVKWNEDYTDPNSDVASMYKDAPPPGMDATIAYLRTLPREAQPGTKWLYKTGETNLIGVLVTKATGKSLAQYAQEKIWQPYGMERDLFWMLDSSGQDIGGCCISVSLRDYARLGQFVLDGGVINGKPVVPNGWFASATRVHARVPGGNTGYGYQWWVNPDGSFQAQGIFGQMIYIDPPRKLVIVLSGAWPKASDPGLSAVRQAFVERIRAALDAEGKAPTS